MPVDAEYSGQTILSSRDVYPFTFGILAHRSI